MTIKLRLPDPPAVSAEEVAAEIEDGVRGLDYWAANSRARSIALSRGWRVGTSHGVGAEFNFTLHHPRSASVHVAIEDVLTRLEDKS